MDQVKKELLGLMMKETLTEETVQEADQVIDAGKPRPTQAPAQAPGTAPSKTRAKAAAGVVKVPANAASNTPVEALPEGSTEAVVEVAPETLLEADAASPQPPGTPVAQGTPPLAAGTPKKLTNGCSTPDMVIGDPKAESSCPGTPSEDEQSEFNTSDIKDEEEEKALETVSADRIVTFAAAPRNSISVDVIV